MVNIFNPKQNLAKLTSGEEGKLLRTFPEVLVPNVRKPERAMERQARRLMVVEMWVRSEKRERVGVEREE